VAVVLARMAWRDDSLESSIDAGMLLSFYIPIHGDETGHGMIVGEPAIVDIDGDGTPEALAVLASHGKEDEHLWKIQVLDLKVLLFMHIPDSASINLLFAAAAFLF